MSPLIPPSWLGFLHRRASRADAKRPEAAAAAIAGYFGKIPARGDFVHRALPRSFTEPLETWWQTVLQAAEQQFGSRQTEIWMVAPVWRFLLPPGVCGREAAAGLWLPSTDLAGRLYPLIFALVANRWDDVQRSSPFLEAAEELGLRAIAEDLEPDVIAAAVTAGGGLRGDAIDHPACDGSLWWTKGGPFVAPTILKASGLLDVPLALSMLSGRPAAL